MPFCTRCGVEAQPADHFCRKCGARQPISGAPRYPTGNASSSLSPRAASILSYVPWLGWIVAIYVLASVEFRQNRDARFHAYQGLYLFVAWLVVDWALTPWFRWLPGRDMPIEGLLHLFLLGLWIFMLIKTWGGERYALPIVGELAERSL